ncbi:hypothetical protein [Streptomyces microflavus]|uniref:hypothetical protein n=1 Tax=Streptomyces microflavus TaxID=1919 RepID=UPI0033B859BB
MSGARDLALRTAPTWLRLAGQLTGAARLPRVRRVGTASDVPSPRPGEAALPPAAAGPPSGGHRRWGR